MSSRKECSGQRNSRYKSNRVRLDPARDEKEGPVVEMNRAKGRALQDEMEEAGRSSWVETCRLSEGEFYLLLCRVEIHGRFSSGVVAWSHIRFENSCLAAV